MRTDCARCKRPMHPAENSRMAPDGFICMPCYASLARYGKPPRDPLTDEEKQRRIDELNSLEDD